ncbi:hypothetical protein [Pedobacter sp. AJM]|uniref:hypothetical protein n=1 Tax=Pedobacter sp. AJM TaxID=2003629 RepID=UPI000B4BC616|nr:hypothetical protein [Pedobacter sp. AJM]OWK70388.1 hypothetical protein CBW18_13095 [Pedobacter sp. AJM]
MIGKIMGCAVLVLATHITFAQDEFNVEVPKDIIILNSTRDYKLALSTAKKASAALHKKLDLRGLMPNHKIGLSMSKGDCMEDAGGDENGYPCYPARGDGAAINDDYISVEYSNAYKGFANGFYIVVAAITDVKSMDMKNKLAVIRKKYPDAYAKRTYIWRGCMH